MSVKRFKYVRRRSAARGFTLIELMVVVIIIGVSAALAMPEILRQVRQTRLRDTAQQVASLYSSARMRALARGSAVLVQYRSTGFTVLESIDGLAMATAHNAGAGCAEEPGLGCLTNDWSGAAGTSRSVAELKPQGELLVSAQSPAGTPATTMDVCFTPMGRSFVSVGGAPLAPLVGAPVFTLQRQGKWAGGFPYFVAVLPNGVARMTRGGAP